MRLRVCYSNSNPSLFLSSSVSSVHLELSNTDSCWSWSKLWAVVAHPPKSLQLIIPTLNYHGPFDRRSEQLYRRHRGDRSGGRVGSHTIYLPPFQNFIQYTPKRNLIVPRAAPAVGGTIRSLAVASLANGRLDSLCCLSLKGIEASRSNKRECVCRCVCGNSSSGRETANSVSRRHCGTQEKLFHIWVWEESIEDILNLPAGTKQERRERQVCRPNPAFHQWCISASVTLVSCPPLWMSRSWSKHLEVTSREALKT
jgi:hypothetical protein